MKVLVDIDGVCLNFLGGLEDYFDGRFKPTGMTSYDFHGEIGVSRSEVFKAMKDVRFFESLKPYEGVVEALDKLQSFCDVVAYTHVSQEMLGIRRKQIKMLGLIGEPFVDDKPPLLVDAVIDDNPKVLRQFESGDLYLISHIYNQSEQNFIRCMNLQEAVDRIYEKFHLVLD